VRRLLPLVFLSVGTVIAWSTVTLGFIRFYRAEGTLLKFTNCTLPNPLTTPCFYGALAFLVSLIWATQLASRTTSLGRGYERLWWLLLASTVFGWSNVAYEVWTWSHSASRTIMGCSAQPLSSPWQSPCLYGSTMFLGAWVCVHVIVRASRPPL
jgi:hypothetical protein